MKLIIAFDIKDIFSFLRALRNISIIPAFFAFAEDFLFSEVFSDEHGLDETENLLPIWIKFWPSWYTAHILLFLS